MRAFSPSPRPRDRFWQHGILMVIKPVYQWSDAFSLGTMTYKQSARVSKTEIRKSRASIPARRRAQAAPSINTASRSSWPKCIISLNVIRRLTFNRNKGCVACLKWQNGWPEQEASQTQCSHSSSPFRPTACIPGIASISGTRLRADRTSSTSVTWRALGFAGHVDIAPLRPLLAVHLQQRTLRASGAASAMPPALARTTSFLCLQTAAIAISQDGRDVDAAAGRLLPRRYGEPVCLRLPGASSQLVLKIERAQLQGSPSALPLPDGRRRARQQCHRRPRRGLHPHVAAPSRFAYPRGRAADRRSSARSRGLGPVARGRLLPASTFPRRRHRHYAASASRRNESMSRGRRCADIAAAAGMSLRYANHLLMREGTSLERFIQHRRLRNAGTPCATRPSRTVQ